MKRALLIGINEYPTQPLNGCINDVTDFANHLVASHGFAAADIRLLTDARATADAIRERLEWFVSGVKTGDTLLLHFSGHGTLFPLRDGDGEVSEVHGVLCPVDFDWTEEHSIFDVELREILNKAPKGTEFIFVSDSCHSGELTRRFRARMFVPPADIRWRLRTAAERKIMPKLLEAHDRCGLISGCRKDQTSADAYFDGRFNGALTYFLLRTLKEPGGLDLPLTGLVDSIRSRLSQAAYDQEPQLRGPDEILSRAFLEP